MIQRARSVRFQKNSRSGADERCFVLVELSETCLLNVTVSRRKKTLLRILTGNADQNIPFDDLCHLLEDAGFDCRIRGSHHIFTQEGIPEILNLQPRGSLAKAYQVRQVRDVLVTYGLADLNED